MDYYKGTIPILDDAPDAMALAHPGTGEAYGAVPRDYAVQPETVGDDPSGLKIIDPSEWDARYDEQEAQQSSLEHLYLRGGKPAFENLDQNGHGYCWAYSTAQATILNRLRDNQPHVRLNPHSVAAIIKKGRDEGGWCGLSAQFFREHGCAEEGNGPGQWPLHSRNLKLDTSECRAQMARHKNEEYWIDLTKSVYDQTLSVKALATCLFQNNACAIDLAAWGHSVCALRWVRVERGVFRPLILNSWKGWGRFGLAVLSGRFFDSLMGAVCLRTSAASKAA
jgi:hypothetical protein